MVEHSSENISIEVITPELAEKYLARNTHNRRLRERTINCYAADIAAGNWEWNGESIKFATDGALLDGQHRLAAIIESGRPIRMLVVRDLPNRTQDTIDTGAKRTFSDVLKLHGEENYTTLAATVRGVHQWESGDRRSWSKSGATHTQLLATLEKYPWLRDGLQLINRCNSHAGLPGTVGGTLWWRFNQIDPVDAEFFFEHLDTGTNLENNSPILTLRKTLVASRDNVRGSRNVTWIAAITCKTWNKYRDGESLTVVSWRAGGASPEKFPEPH